MNIQYEFDESLQVSTGMNLEVSRKNLERYKVEINKLIEDVQSLIVQDEPTMVKAVEFGTMASKILKRVKDTRDEHIKEPSEFIKSVKGISKPFEDSLESIKEIAQGKIKTYKAVQEQKRREDEAKLQAEARKLEEKLKKQAEAKGIEPVSVPVPVLPKMQKTTHTEFGSQYSREVWKFDLVDIDLVPHEYLEVNGQAVRQAIKMGRREIPGIKIWQDDSIVFRG